MSVDNNSYNKGGFIAFVGSMVFSIGFILYISFVHPGIELDKLKEQRDEARQAMAEEFDIKTVESPWVYSDELVAHGKKVYQTSCGVCHGASGAGDGPGGAALRPRPRNLIVGDWTQGGTSVQLYTTLEKGIAGTSMASFNYLPKSDRWAIVHYIRSITENKPEDNEAELNEFGPNSK